MVKKSNKKISQLQNGNGNSKALETWLKSAADLLRSRTEGLQYIITLLFYKRLCDVFDDEVMEVKQDLSQLNDKEFRKVVKEAKLTRFFIPKEAHFQEVRKTTVNLGERLTRALWSIAQENPTLQGVIDVVDFNETRTSHGQRVRIISDDTLSKLLEVFNRHTIGLDETEPDVIGRAYEYLLRLYAAGKGKTAGEFYTPREIAFLIAYCLDPQEGEEIYDPTVGSGGLLIKNHIVLKEKTSGKIRRPLKLYGQEQDHLTYALAKINMFVHNIEQTDIRLGDTLLNPAFLENKRLKNFDAIVANPMWNQKGYEERFYDSDQYERFPFGYPPARTADWGWVQHMFASLKSEGRLAVVLDTGAVARGSGKRKNREKAIRQKFIEQDLIDAVLLLPENLFYNTSASGLILFIRKKKQENRKGRILLINASREFEKGRPKNFLTQQHIQKISKIYRSFEEVDGLSKIITLEEAKEAEYNLSPSRFVVVTEEGRYRQIKEIEADIKAVKSQRNEVENKLEKILTLFSTKERTGDDKLKIINTGKVPEGWEVVRLGNIARIRTGQKDVNEGNPAGLYPFFTCAKEITRSDTHSFDTEAILIAGNGEVGDTKYYNGKFEAYQRTYVLDNFGRNILYVYQYLLLYLKPILGISKSGSTMPYIRKSDLENFLISIPISDKEQSQIVEILQTINKGVELEKREIKLREELSQTMLQKLMTAEVRISDAEDK